MKDIQNGITSMHIGDNMDNEDRIILGSIFLIIVITHLPNIIGQSESDTSSHIFGTTIIPTDTPKAVPIDTPIILPTVLPKQTPDLIFDVDVDTKVLLYKKGDCTILIKGLKDVGSQDAESGNCTSDDWENVKKKLVTDPIIEPTIVEPTVSPTTIPTTPITNSNKPFENVWDFVRYVQNNWKYVTKTKTDIVQTPQESFKLLSGDCQDFSSMVAYYIQEVYGYDTEIIIIEQETGKYHAVAFVSAEQSVINDDTQYCRASIPILTNKDGREYIPIDWTICPGWMWTSYNNDLRFYEWNDFAGKVHG